MKLLKIEKLNKERGSATVEAIISFTGFLFVIFTILNIINFCRAQMLISNAVDTATKEITQYSYFYKMSGLQKFSDDISANAEQGKTNLNDVIGTVGDLYSSIGTAADNTAEHAANIKNAVEEGNVNLNDVQNTLAGIKTDGTNIETSINSVMSAFDSVQDNPLLYMKSIIAVAGNESLDLLKSHVIAAPLARSFTAKHFGKTTAEANSELKKLGVVDGLDGMNFKMSTVFSSDAPEDVHIVVYYRLKIVQIFGWTTLEVPMCKESVARAWLGGDDVQKVVTPMVPATPEEEPQEEGSESEENKEEENIGGNTDLWALPTRSEDGYYAVRSTAFDELLGETYGFEAYSNTFVKGHNGATGYGCMNVSGAGADEGTFIAQNAYYSMANSLKDAKSTYDPESPTTSYNYNPDNIKQIVFVVYVPENIPDDKLNTIKANSEKGAEEYKKQAKDLLGRELDVNISFVKAGGTYDYGSEK